MVASAAHVVYNSSSYDIITKGDPTTNGNPCGIIIVAPPLQELYIPKSFSGMLECISDRESEGLENKKIESDNEIKKCRKNIEKRRNYIIQARKEKSIISENDKVEKAANFISKKGKWDSKYGDLMPSTMMASDCWPPNHSLIIMQPDPKKPDAFMSITLSLPNSVNDGFKEITISYDGHGHYKGVGKNGGVINTKEDGDCFINAVKIGCPEGHELKTMDVESIRAAMAHTLRSNTDLFAPYIQNPVSSHRHFSSLEPSPVIEMAPSQALLRGISQAAVPVSAFRSGLTPKATELTMRAGRPAYMDDDIRTQATAGQVPAFRVPGLEEKQGLDSV